MSVRLYMDQNFHGDVTEQLRRRGVDVVTAEEEGTKELDDTDLIDLAGSLARVIVSHDRDMLVEATVRMRTGVQFSGVIYAHPLRISVGQMVVELEMVAKVYDPMDMANQIQRLPL